MDPDTYELVYVNDYMQRAYGLSDSSSWVGEKCYKILADRETPCDNCLNDRLRRDCFCTVTRRNRKTGQNLFMRTTLIPWQGKNYRFSMAADINQYINRDLAENRVIFRKAMANDVIAIGMREADSSVGLQKMLAHIGRSLQAERVLIFEEQGSRVSATYEWHQEDLQPVAHTVQHIPINSLRPLYAKFDTKQMAIIEDVQSFLRDNPGFTPYISGVRRLVSGHLTQSGRSLGFTEVINPSALAFKSAGLLLSTLTLFLAIMLRNRDIFRSLERLGATDQMTGVGNRRGFAEYLRALPDGMSLAFIFGDLNGLKQTNDTQGHEVGDQLIRQAAQSMKNLTGDIAVFRMGGDEFMLVARDVDKTQARRSIRDLRARYRSSGISMALGYYRMPDAYRQYRRRIIPGRPEDVCRQGSDLRPASVLSPFQAQGQQRPCQGSGTEALDDIQGDEGDDAAHDGRFPGHPRNAFELQDAAEVDDGDANGDGCQRVATEVVFLPFEPGHEEDGGDIGPDIAACRAEHLAGTCGAACEDGDADDADADVGQHGDGRVFRRQQEGDQVDDERLQGNRRLGKGQGNDQIGRNTIHSDQQGDACQAHRLFS